MTLMPIFLCCDDGNIYKTDYVEGDGWAISINEFQDDELWIPATDRPKGQRRDIPRPVVPSQEIIERFGLPIASVRFKSHSSGPPQFAIYAINWNGKAFPRSLLPENAKPNTKGGGTYCCCTRAHRRFFERKAERA